MKQTWCNSTANECWIICAAFRCINKVVDSVNRPKKWKSTLYCVNFLTGPFWHFISWPRRYRITGIVQKEPRFISSDDSLEAWPERQRGDNFCHMIVSPYVVITTSEKEPRKWTKENLLRLRWFSIKLNNPEVRIQAFHQSRGSGNGKVSEE
jgi:hypothetical protein